MRLLDVTRRAGRSLRNAKARTLLTSLAIGVGAFTIMLSLAAGAGGRQYAADIVSSNTNPRELYVQPKQEMNGDPNKPREYSDDPVINFGGGFSQKLLKKSDIEKLKKVSNVESVTPLYNVNAKYVTREGQKKYQAGIEAYLATMKQEYLAGSGDSIEEDGVVIPDTYVEALGFDSPKDALGKTIDIVIGSSEMGQPDKTFTLSVVGVVKKSALSAATGTGGMQIDNDVISEMYAYAQAGTPLQDAYAAATVLAKSEADVAGVKENIDNAGYLAQSAEDLMGFIFQFINVLQGILLGFGALAVLTSVFGIINTQYISVLERTQQIGLMKALGMRRRDVGRLFKIEAAWIGFLGGALGASVAFLAGETANPLITDALALEDGTKLLIFEPYTFAVVILGLMFVAVVAGILPSRKAAKLDPIEALRTE